jgi:hypothetical protein
LCVLDWTVGIFVLSCILYQSIGESDEAAFYTVAVLCRCLENCQAGSLGEVKNILLGHLPFRKTFTSFFVPLLLSFFDQILFVGHNDYLDIWLGMVIDFCQPVIQVFEGILVEEIED